MTMFPPDRKLTVEEALAKLPEGFTSDGLSGGFPDWMFRRYKLGEIDWPHAHWYCTRCWVAGSMTHRRQKQADKNLYRHANERLPWYWKIVPFILLGGVRAGGHGSFDTCYSSDPLDASDEQREAGHCRHSMPRPDWQEAIAGTQSH
jgi:hypothetical protein